jgi:glycosyltransferase involved in cell wall biosynthesis
MFVSVLTTTYNRSKFIPALIQGYQQQRYPHASMEWLILDDGDPEEQRATQALFDAASQTLPNIRYIQSPVKHTMGRNMNTLTAASRGDILVIMDDDDVYPPTRVSSVVTAFRNHPTYQLAGCSKVYMYFEEDDTIYVTGPYHDKHALHCTLAYRKSYLLDHRYDDEELCAVEKAFTNNFCENIHQLEPTTTILHVVHSSNTYQKKRSVGFIRPTSWSKDTFFLSS